MRLGAPAMLWRRALHCGLGPPSAADGGNDARECLAFLLATALADLLALRGDDELAAAALRIQFDPRLAAWHDALAADASRPPRVAAAASRLIIWMYVCPCSSLGVRASLPSSSAHPLPIAAAACPVPTPVHVRHFLVSWLTPAAPA